VKPKTLSRPGGRSARVRSAVIEALMAELTEHGLAGATIEGIARRAGVNKTTIYRRWGSKESLVLDAMLDRGERRVPIPDTGSLHEDVRIIAAEIVANLGDPASRALVHAVAAEASADSPLIDAVREFWRVRFGLLTGVVERAVARGEVPPGTDPRPLVEALLGMLYLRLLVTRAPLDRRFATTVADVVTAAACG
jgi:AcrR family transcriptional regulator